MVHDIVMAERAIGRQLLRAPIVKVGRWQSTDVGHIDTMDTPELLNFSIDQEIPQSMEELAGYIRPNLPWAENQFQERVCGKPLNPGRTFLEWPWYKHNVNIHRREEKFSHTYMERFWPKMAGGSDIHPAAPHRGIQYKYGDLNDVVNLLAQEPYTRQAYLPIFFPEDTGVVHGERVPCTLGYHFLFRDSKLNIIYHIRSCDFVRHFRDDVYMAARLCQWMIRQVRQHLIDEQTYEYERWSDCVPGTLTMHIGSLHCFRGDLIKLRKEYGPHHS